LNFSLETIRVKWGHELRLIRKHSWNTLSFAEKNCHHPKSWGITVTINSLQAVAKQPPWMDGI
jgi:hypothetical protein